jgi:hypothetical protein
LAFLDERRLEAALAVRRYFDLELAELGLNGFRLDAVAFVARVVVDALAVVVTEAMGHIGVEGAFEHRLRLLLQEVVLAEWVFGVLVCLEEWVDELGVGRCGLGLPIQSVDCSR